MLRRTFTAMIGVLPFFRFKQKKMVKVIEVVTDKHEVTFREAGSGNRATFVQHLYPVKHNIKALVKQAVKIKPGYHIYVFKRLNLTEQLVVVGNNTVLLVDPDTMVVHEKWMEID